MWKAVVGWEERYAVSTDGRVFSFRAGRYLQPVLHDGYPQVCLYGGPRPKSITVHRLVALTFLGSPPTPKHEVNHIDENRANSNVTNLEWVTRQENIRYARRNGRKWLQGEINGRAKITLGDAQTIRQSRSSGEALAMTYGLTRSTINKIRRGASWDEAGPCGTPIGRGSPKLSVADVAQIRQLPGDSLSELARRFGVTKATIWKIRRGYTHLAST